MFREHLYRLGRYLQATQGDQGQWGIRKGHERAGNFGELRSRRHFHVSSISGQERYFKGNEVLGSSMRGLRFFEN